MGEELTSPASTTVPETGAAPRHVRGEALYAEQVRHLYRFRARLRGDAARRCSDRGRVVGRRSAAAARPVARRDGRGNRGPLRTLPRVSAPQAAPAQARSWCRYFVAGAAARGCCGASSGPALYPSESLPHEFLVMLIIAGMVVSAVLVLAPVQHAFLAFLIPAVLPSSRRCSSRARRCISTSACCCSCFFVVMLATGPLVSGDDRRTRSR